MQGPLTHGVFHLNFSFDGVFLTSFDGGGSVESNPPPHSYLYNISSKLPLKKINTVHNLYFAW